MPTPDLLAPNALDAFPGGPYPADVVKAAGAAIRQVAGWHIAPAASETITIETSGGTALLLPTMHLVAIDEIRDVTNDPAGVVLEGYRTHATERFEAGIVDRPGGWPYCGVLEVDIRHGHAACPDDLKAVVAEICRKYLRGDLSQRSLGDKSESWRADLSVLSQQSLASYVIPGSP